MSLFETAARFVAQHGEVMALARSTEVTTVTLKGKRFGDALVETGGSSARQSFRIKIGTAELLASAWTNKAPARKDTITVGGRARTVDNAYPLKDGDTTALFVLEVSG